MAAHSDLLIGQPIYRSADFSVGSDVEQCTLYTVPAGRIFVLEMVMAKAFIGTGGSPPIRLVLTDPEGLISSGNRGVSFRLEESASTVYGRGYLVNQLVRLYYREHITLQAYLLLQQAGTFIHEVAISGYVVTDPDMASPPWSTHSDI